MSLRPYVLIGCHSGTKRRLGRMDIDSDNGITAVNVSTAQQNKHMTHHCMPLRAKAARKRSTLTQGHVAAIIGHLSKGQVSRMENGCRRPHPRFIVGTIILYHRGIDDLFQRLYQEVEDHVAREALRMWEGLEGATSPPDLKRREALADILSAIAARHDQKGV